MMMKLGESIKLVSAISPALQAAGDVNGTVIDRLGFYGAIDHLSVGAATGTPTAQSVALKLQHGKLADGSDMADVTDATITALTADNKEAELNINLDSLSQYIRVVVTTAFTGGTTPKIPVAVNFALGEATTIPS